MIDPLDFLLKKTRQTRRRKERVNRDRKLGLQKLEERLALSGTTIITHGFLLNRAPNLPVWVEEMSNAVALQAAEENQSLSNSRVAQFRLELDNLPFPFGPIVSDFEYHGDFLQSNPVALPQDFNLDEVLSGEAVISIDWSAVAFLGEATTQEVASLVTDFLLDELGGLGQQLLANPIHLIGHSRGASLVSALAEDLGELGIVVDHVTHLDTHPLALPTDHGNFGPVVTENVLFADSYYRSDGLDIDFDGEPVSGAHNIVLQESVLGDDLPYFEINGYSSEHSDVHAWYHGTIGASNSFFPGTDGEINIPASWYGGPHPTRDTAGYFFSNDALGANFRPSGGVTPALGGTAPPREAVSLESAAWPNIVDLILLGPSNVFQLGDPVDTIDVAFRFQDRDALATNDSLNFEISLDNNRNPYDGDTGISLYTPFVGGHVPLQGSSNQANGGFDPTFYNGWQSTTTGIYSLQAFISDSQGQSRNTYLWDDVVITPPRKEDIFDSEIVALRSDVSTNHAIVNGTLVIAGSDTDDVVILARVSPFEWNLYINGVSTKISDGSFSEIYADGGDGDDRLLFQEYDKVVRAFGRAGNDLIVGGTDDDLLFGGDGNDVILGWMGSDWVLGENGNDTLLGQQDALVNSINQIDHVVGGAGIDEIVLDSDDLTDHAGRQQDKIIHTADQVKSLFINSGKGYWFDQSPSLDHTFAVSQSTAGNLTLTSDQITKTFTNGYFDPITGTVAELVIVGGAGNEHVNVSASPVPVSAFLAAGMNDFAGSIHNDFVYGAGTENYFSGAGGADEVVTLAGNANYLDGGDGDDIVVGAGGGNTLVGGAGNDEFQLGTGDVAADSQPSEAVTALTERVAKRRRDRINANSLANQSVVTPQVTPVVPGRADATPQISEFTSNTTTVTRGEGVLFTVRAVEDNWARLVLFVDENGNKVFDSSERKLQQSRGRNQDWRAQIGTSALSEGTYTIRAELTALNGTKTVSEPIVLTVNPDVVHPEPTTLPTTLDLTLEDSLVLVPHRNGDAVVENQVLGGAEQIDFWEITPVNGGNFRFRTTGPTDTVVGLYDAAGTLIVPGDDDGDITAPLTADTTYYFAVKGNQGASGSYGILLTGINQTVQGNLIPVAPTYQDSVSGTLTASHRLEYFEAIAPAGADLLDIHVAYDPGLDLFVRVATEASELVGLAQLGKPGARALLENLPVTPGETYFVTVYAMNGTTGNFTVTGDYFLDELGFAASLSPSPASYTPLVPLQNGTIELAGQAINSGSQIDYYLVTPPSGGSSPVDYTFETTGTLDTQIGVYIYRGTTLSDLLAEADEGGNGRNAKLTVGLERADEYLVAVRSSNNETGSYGLQMRGIVPNVTPITIGGLELTGTSSQQTLNNSFHYKIYEVTAPVTATSAAAEIFVPVSSHPNEDLDASLRVTDEDGNLILYANNAGVEMNEPAVSFAVSPGAKYYLTVYGETLSIGDYTLNVDFAPDLSPSGGAEFQLTAETTLVRSPHVDRNADGNTVSVWSGIPLGNNGNPVIYARRFDGNGNVLGSEITVSQTTPDGLSSARVAVADHGRFMVAWDNKFRLYAANGTPLTSEQTYRPAEAFYRQYDVAVDSSGNFAIVWLDFDPTLRERIQARTYNNVGSAISSTFEFSQQTGIERYTPRIISTGAGKFAAIWIEKIQVNGSDVFVPRISEHSTNGTQLTAPFTASSSAYNFHADPEIAVSNDGSRVAVVWQAHNGFGTQRDYRGRMFDSSLSPLANDFLVEAGVSTNAFRIYDVDFAAGNNALVSWSGPDRSGDGVLARQVAADGTIIGPTYTINQTIPGNQVNGRFAGDGNSKYLFVWHEEVSGVERGRGRQFELTGALEPEITVTDNSGAADDLSVDFGNPLENSGDVLRTVAIANDGNDDLVITGLFLAGDSASLFSLSSSAGFTLTPGQSQDITVTMNPALVGNVSAALIIDHNDTGLDTLSGDVDEDPLLVSLTATIVGAPRLEVVVAPSTVKEDDGANAGSVLITRRYASNLSSQLLVSLSSNDTTEATVPGFALIPAGQISTLVPLTAVDDTVPDGTQTVTISATASGFAAGSGNVAVESVIHAEEVDFNSNGTVDGFDFLSWQRGTALPGGATSSDGDANGDAVVDSEDLSGWDEYYGEVLSAPISSGPASLLSQSQVTAEALEGNPATVQKQSHLLAPELVDLAMQQVTFSRPGRFSPESATDESILRAETLPYDRRISSFNELLDRSEEELVEEAATNAGSTEDHRRAKPRRGQLW